MQYFRDSKLDQELDFGSVQRLMNYKRRKDQLKKKLIRLKKLQKLRLEAEESGGEVESVSNSRNKQVCQISNDPPGHSQLGRVRQRILYSTTNSDTNILVHKSY